MLLGMLGMLGLYIEFNQPGMLVPGVVGATCLLLALIAMQILACLAWGVDMLEGGSIEEVLAQNLDFFLRGAAAAKG